MVILFFKWAHKNNVKGRTCSQNCSSLSEAKEFFATKVKTIIVKNKRLDDSTDCNWKIVFSYQTEENAACECSQISLLRKQGHADLVRF